MDLLAYVNLLREVQWEWSQDQVATVVLHAGWHYSGGTRSLASHERRKYTNSEAWHLTVDSFERQLVQMNIVFRWLEYDTESSPHLVEQYHAQLANEYAACMTMLRSSMGTERYEGEWCEEAPCSWRCEDANRLAEWSFGAGTLTLCLFTGRLGKTRAPSGWLEGCGLELIFYPNEVLAEQ